MGEPEYPTIEDPYKRIERQNEVIDKYRERETRKKSRITQLETENALLREGQSGLVTTGVDTIKWQADRITQLETENTEQWDLAQGIINEHSAHITKLESQLQAVEEAHADKICEVGRLEALGSRLYEACKSGRANDFSIRITDAMEAWLAEPASESQSVHWRAVADGWPEVEGERYLAMEKDGSLYFLCWFTGVKPESSGWHRVTHYILINALLGLPGGPAQ